MSTFTPGPWSACHKGDCSCGMISGGDDLVATITNGVWGDTWPKVRLIEDGIHTRVEAYMDRMDYGSVPKDVAAANARLIAAAPELLSSTQMLLDVLDELAAECDAVSEFQAPIRMARAAIEKATTP